jgi:hypothetical protein
MRERTHCNDIVRHSGGHIGHLPRRCWNARWGPNSVSTLVGQRVFGIALGYEDVSGGHG